MTAERSPDVFEAIPGYPLPPLPPLPAVDDYADFERQGFLKHTPTSRAIVGKALRILGYPAFHAKLPQQVEALLRKTNMRDHMVFGPAYSATVALNDDRRALTAIQRAATMVVAARSLCDDIMRGALPPDEHRGQSLEMGQYPNLFSTSFIVENGRLQLHKSRCFDQLAVVVDRRIFTLHIGAAGLRSTTDIARALEDIVVRVRRAPTVLDDEAPGTLSAGDSKTLARSLGILERTPMNARSLASLRNSFVILCLDLDNNPATAADAALITQAGNPANRWYLASLQLVVFGNAKACGICSFSAYLDGNVMMRAAAELYRRAAAAPVERDNRVTGNLVGVELDWALPHKLVYRAWRDVRRLQVQQQATFKIERIGRKTFEALGIDAVSAFVVALAWATKQIAGDLPNILQLVTVSNFRCVPIGAAVVTTPELRSFVDFMEKEPVDAAHAARLLIASLESQARECRAERQKLSLRWTVEGFLRTRRGLSRVVARSVTIATVGVLTALGVLTKDRIVISHPAIYPEVALLGRPGVRLPYVSHYGLHYQMFSDHVILTLMPGQKWTVENAVLVNAVEASLQEVAHIAALVYRSDKGNRLS
jgi:hypothetical protein